MKDRKILNALKPCLPFYLLALLLILGMKYGYGKADSEELLWILAPTCWWVRFLSGIPFQWIPDVGYVSHSARFIIAKSCSGVQFMMVSIAALVFSFLHRKKTLGQAGRWMLDAVGISYFYTIFVINFCCTRNKFDRVLLLQSKIQYQAAASFPKAA